MLNPDSPAANAYYAALGRFMHEFGRTENHMAFMLHRYVGLRINNAYEPIFAPGRGTVLPAPTMELLRALIGAQRSGTLAEIIKAVMLLGGIGEAERAEMDETLKHFGEIRFIRDRIAHNGAWEDREHPTEWRWRTSNYPQARKPEQITNVFFKIEDLQAASRDLVSIRNQIDALLIRENPNVRPDVEKAGRFGPWHYKPSAPVPAGR